MFNIKRLYTSSLNFIKLNVKRKHRLEAFLRCKHWTFPITMTSSIAPMTLEPKQTHFQSVPQTRKVVQKHFPDCRWQWFRQRSVRTGTRFSRQTSICLVTRHPREGKMFNRKSLLRRLNNLLWTLLSLIRRNWISPLIWTLTSWARQRVVVWCELSTVSTVVSLKL